MELRRWVPYLFRFCTRANIPSGWMDKWTDACIHAFMLWMDNVDAPHFFSLSSAHVKRCKCSFYSVVLVGVEMHLFFKINLFMGDRKRAFILKTRVCKQKW